MQYPHGVPSRARSLWLVVMPGLFVFLWSTGYIGAKYSLPYAEPSLLYLLIRRGEAYRVSTLFYLVPATTAVLGYLAFGERLAPTALVGMVLVAVGAALVNAPGPRRA